jgi:predicted metal-dependent hydrolase
MFVEKIFLTPMKRDLRQSQDGELLIEGKRLAVTFRRRANARRIILRIDRSGLGIVLTLPHYTSHKAALTFAASEKAWILERIAESPERVPFAPGQRIPLRGRAHAIQATGERGTVRLSAAPEPAILVPGAAVHLERRLTDWLKRQAALDLAKASRLHAERLGVRFVRISVRDTASRWGSCSASGTLSYCWRLILAPPFVLDYVAAHEVAHLKEMNHGRRFWSLVHMLCPDADAARSWLKAHGNGLHLYGPEQQ